MQAAWAQHAAGWLCRRRRSAAAAAPPPLPPPMTVRCLQAACTPSLPAAHPPDLRNPFHCTRAVKHQSSAVKEATIDGLVGAAKALAVSSVVILGACKLFPRFNNSLSVSGRTALIVCGDGGVCGGLWALVLAAAAATTSTHVAHAHRNPLLFSCAGDARLWRLLPASGADHQRIQEAAAHHEPRAVRPAPRRRTHVSPGLPMPSCTFLCSGTHAAPPLPTLFRHSMHNPC